MLTASRCRRFSSLAGDKAIGNPWLEEEWDRFAVTYLDRPLDAAQTPEGSSRPIFGTLQPGKVTE